MNYFKILVVVIAVFQICTSCKKDSEDELNLVSDSEILFIYEYQNMAWGIAHSGWMIDSAGNVHCFNLPENWNPIDNEGTISKADLDANLNQTYAKCLRLDKTVVESKSMLIQKAAEGSLINLDIYMADAGISRYFAFTFDKSSQTYTPILLKQVGDFSIKNSATEAEQLYEWLDGIHQTISRIVNP